MSVKYLKAPLHLKADGPEGSVSALFSVSNELDSDEDVVLPSFFEGADQVPMAAWGHAWDALPPGKGAIRVTPEGAQFDGEFFTDTTHGRDHYLTIKHMGGLQEWSFGFRVLESERGTFKGKPCRFLKRGEIFEVSPVLVGANRNTRTLDIKAGSDPTSELKPYANEHACRLRDPGDFQANSFRRVSRRSGGKRYDIIMGKLKGESAMTEQTYRYPKDVWTAAEAKAHCSEHDGSFEAAKAEKGDHYYPALEAPEGSYEDLAEDISEAFMADGHCDDDCHVTTIATFPGGIAYVYVCEPYAMDGQYYQVQYDIGADGDPVITGIQPVEASIAFAPDDDQMPGISYAGAAERVLAAVSQFTARSKSLADLRAKEGRTFSAANVQRMTTILSTVRDAMDEMDGMLTAAAPPQKADTAAIRREWLATQARLSALRLMELSA